MSWNRLWEDSEIQCFHNSYVIDVMKLIWLFFYCEIFMLPLFFYCIWVLQWQSLSPTFVNLYYFFNFEWNGVFILKALAKYFPSEHEYKFTCPSVRQIKGQNTYLIIFVNLVDEYDISLFHFFNFLKKFVDLFYCSFYELSFIHLLYLRCSFS